MSSMTTMTTVLPAVALATCLFACDAPKETAGAATASSPPSAAVSTPPAKASARPSATAAAPDKKPSHPCPEGTEGDGTLKVPCEAKGTSRIMDVAWTGKIDDKGPFFRVTSKAKLEILYGKIVVYFYDKAGKQLELPAATGDDKPRTRLSCAGNIFAGPMKAAEKAVLQFSCVKKKDVPEGATAIEAELQTVGFTGKDGKKSDTFWRNNDLAPKDRPKGGVK